MAELGTRYKSIQSVFSRGELSPRIIGRVDNDSYYKAVKYSVNFLPFPQGATTKRPGTFFVNEVKDSADKTILIPFRFSTVQNYVIEAGDQYFRFYRNRGLVESSPGVAYELATPWPASVVEELSYVQSYDRLYVFHQDYQPRVITRTSDTSWSITTLTFIEGPFLPINSTATTITPSAATGSITLTASTPTFVAGDVGRQMRIRVGSNDWGWVTITAYTSATVVGATVERTLTTAAATTSWAFSYFGGTQGWPATATIFEERLIMANAPNYPASIFASVVGAFSDSVDMKPSNNNGTVVDDNGFVYSIGNDQVNAITWLSSGRTLMIGTTGGEHSMTGGTASSYAPVTPDNVTIKRESKTGSAENIRALRVGNAILYVSRSSRKVRELYYDFGIDSYISRDVTIFNSHITDSAIIDCDFQDEPDPTMWAVLANGKLLGFSYERVQEVEGWHRHILGGVDAKVKRVCCIPRPDKSGDDLWLIVSRTINGSAKQYVEYMAQYYEPEINGKNLAYFSDSASVYDGRLLATLTPGATTGSGVTFTAGSSVFAASMVGDEIRSGTGRALITAYSSGTQVTADIITPFSSTSPIASGSWSVATKNITGITWLLNETVTALADGASAGEYTVNGSGEIILPDYASYVVVGLPYEAEIHLLPIEAQSLGTIAGAIRRAHKIYFYLTNTIGLRLGNATYSKVYAPPFGGANHNLNEGPPLYNGVFEADPPLDYDKEGVLKISHDWPTNITINYVVQEMSING